MPKYAKVLQSNWLFETLSDAQLAALSKATRKTTIQSGRLLFAEGDRADGVYKILTGEIAIETFSKNGRPTRVATMGPGDVFGELAVFGDVPRTADARAITDCALLKIGANAINALVCNEPIFSKQIIKFLIERISNGNAQIENFAMRSLKARVASLLAVLYDENNGDPNIRITQHELAERLSATREKVNINLQTLQRSGAVKLSRGRIDIIDSSKLIAFSVIE